MSPLRLVHGNRPRPLSSAELRALTADRVAAWRAKREVPAPWWSLAWSLLDGLAVVVPVLILLALVVAAVGVVATAIARALPW